MNMSQNIAIMVVLLVSFLWGSWIQVVKHTGKYPIYAFLTWVYIFSLIVVWGIIGFFHEALIPSGVFTEILNDMPKAIIILICGGVYAIGMQMQMTVISKMGLLLSSSITSTCMILSGLLVSIILGGISENSSVGLILIAGLLLICGTITCQLAGIQRDKDIQSVDQIGKGEKKALRHNVVLLVITSGIMLPFYSIATSIGLTTPLRPDGFSSLTCMGLLSIGALIGTSVFTAIKLRRDKLKFVLPSKNMIILCFMAFIAALCHFGGNILHSIAAPVVSVVIASGIGYSFGMWSYLWGLLYGEFRGASKKTGFILTGGVLFFALGVSLLTFNV